MGQYHRVPNVERLPREYLTPSGVKRLIDVGRKRERYGARMRREDNAGRFLFTTERRAPMTPAGFRKLLARIADKARIPFPVHPHMLRHACGYKLANDGHDTRALQHYLGHKNITHTVRYSELSPSIGSRGSGRSEPTLFLQLAIKPPGDFLRAARLFHIFPSRTNG
jgi:hypothetical protein